MKLEPASEAAAWPAEIRLSADKRTLTVRFEDGRIRIWPAETLRIESPSAEVQGHAPAQKQTVIGKENVRILKITPVGHYAVRLTFDDGHDTGIYTWHYLAAEIPSKG